MGSYLIPGAASVNEAIDYIGEPQLTQTWEQRGADVLFVDTALTNAECAALYAGFMPSGVTDVDYRPPLPAAVQDAIDTFRAFDQANPTSLTQSQIIQLFEASMTLFRWLNSRLT